MAVSTFTRAIAASSDDASEAVGNPPNPTATIAAMVANLAWAGQRFTDLNIPVGATITSAVIGVELTDTGKNDAQGTWFGNDVDDAAAFTTADGDVDGRTLTSASVAWTTNDLGSAGAVASTPNLAAILQEIVDRPGWEPGNAVVFLYRHESGAEFLQWGTWDHTTAAAPVLTVTFTTDDYGSREPIVEAAFGADLTADRSTWTWTDLSDRLIPQAITIKRGRPDEGQRTNAGSTVVVLDNTDGALTPDHPVSPYYPYVDRGTPLRIRLDGEAVTTHLLLDGVTTNYASTPDAAGHDFTGDMCIWGDANISRSAQLISKWADTSDERSYYLYVTTTNRIGFVWSEDGTGPGIRAAFSTEYVPDVSASGRLAYAAEVDADDGAGGFVIRFYTAPTQAGPWTLLGDAVTADSDDVTTSITIYAGTAPLTIGLPTFGTMPVGEVYGAGTRTGTSLTGGTIISNPDFTAQTPGATSFADTASTPKTWTLAGDAEITDQDRRLIRFFGQMDGINPTWPEGDNGEAEVEISASGMLRRMGQGDKPLASTLYRGVMSKLRADRLSTTDLVGVVAYWPFEDDRGSPSAASPIPGVQPVAVGPGLEFGAGEPFNASRSLAKITDTIHFSAQVPAYVTTATQGTRFDFFAYMTQPSGGVYLFACNTSGTVVHWSISYSGSALTVQGYNGVGTLVVNNTSGLSDVFFDSWVLWSFHIKDDGAGTVTYTLTPVKIPDGFGATYTSTVAGVAGNMLAIHNWGTTAPDDGWTIGHFIVSTGKSLGWLAGYDTAWVGESAAHRWYRLCTEEGLAFRCIGDGDVGASFRGDTSKSAAMGPQLPKPLLDLFQECVDADFGLMVEERDRFGLVYRTGRSLQSQDARLALDASTRSVGGQVVSDVRNPFAPTKDDQRIRNDITAKREGGSLFRVTTTPPPPVDDLYNEEVSVNVETDLHLRDYAYWRLHLGTWPGMRYPSVTTDLSDSPHLVDDWLDMEMGDRITVTNLPTSHPSTTVDILAEGVDEIISPHRWELVFNASPGGPWRVGVREDADEPARRDTSGTVLNDDMSTVDTAVLFVVVTGLEWTQDAADYPFDINIGGEQMTAESITDLGGGEFELEVIRSVNGVVKEHTTGDAITLWQPAYRGF